MPRPFVNERFEFTQPDGTKITLTGTGNQFSAIFEDADGYVVVHDPQTRYYVYARLDGAGQAFEPTDAVVGRDAPAPGLAPHLRPSPDAGTRAMGLGIERAGAAPTRWQQRVAQKQIARRSALSAARGGAAFAPPSETTVGTFVGLCLLIEFPDVPATIPQAEVSNFCNEVGYTGFGNNGSVHDYFQDVSNGRLTYTNMVAPYYTAAQNRAHYTDEGIQQGVRARQLILEALQHLVQTGFDFSPLTTDDQGFIRALNVFYVGDRVNNWAQGLWPHAWHLAQPVTVAPGKSFFDYQFTNMGDELALGTFCHENGHMICDFPDLYDYGTDGFASNGIGDYCLMCAGGRDEKNPVRVGAYLNRLAGWAHSVTPVAPGTGTLAADRDDFLIHPKSADEYFLIENRLATGRDADLPDQGACVWHCSETGSNEHQGGTATLHYECALVQADNQMHLEQAINLGNPGDLYRQGSQTAFGDTTAPNSRWWDGSVSGLEITGIGAAGPALAYTVPGAGGGGGGGPVTVSSAPALAIPDNAFAGIADVIDVAEAGTIGAISVSVDISHSYRGDLIVRLRAPSGVAALLHNRAGGSQNDLQQTYVAGATPALGVLLGEQMQGAWRLEVSDRAAIDTGVLNNWSLTLEASSAPAEIAEAPGTTIPDNDPAGIARMLTAAGAGTVGTLAVDLDITHSFIGDLVIHIVSPQGDRVALHNRQGGGLDNIIRTYTEATTPALAVFAGQPTAGDWRLEVADLAGADVGKLNRWAVRFHGAPGM